MMGVANDHSIAWAISQALWGEGAELSFTHHADPAKDNHLVRHPRHLTLLALGRLP